MYTEMMIIMNIECNVCGKKYRNVDALMRHREKCMVRNPNLDIIMQETMDMPHTRTMLSALLKRVTDLEEKVKMNTNYIKREKKKINIIEFLNEQTKSQFHDKKRLTTFDDYKLNITIDKQTVHEYLNAQSPLWGLVDIVVKSLNKYDKDQVPIRCFSQKRSVFYVRVQNESNDGYYWVELTDIPEYEHLIMNIQQKLLREYEKIHNKKLNKTSTNLTQSPQDKYFQNIKNILMTDQQSDSVCRYFKHKLYDAIKREVDIKYEIVF
jgi:hypothetical protein